MTDHEALADKLFPKSEATDFSESILSVPPEQRRLHTETLDFTISTIVDYVKRGHVFVPEFQRRYVWTQSQASRLIESLIIQCPIPVVYLNQEPDEKLSVIDGNQRIQSLVKFVDNHFELRGLTAYPELEGSYFHQLDPRFQRHITNRTLRCIVIMKDTHPQVKFDVFERLNTGSVKLTPQELRHGLYHGRLMKLVSTLAKGKEWHSLFEIDSKRMKVEELIIRFLAMHYDMKSYKQPLSAFLNEFSERYRDLVELSEGALREIFDRTVRNLIRIFGNYAFKVFDRQLAVQSKFNAALFDAEILAASQLEIPQKISKAKHQAFLGAMASLFEDEEFQKTITRATTNTASLRIRVERVRQVVQEQICRT